jgi:hypothetical protein
MGVGLWGCGVVGWGGGVGEGVGAGSSAKFPKDSGARRITLFWHRPNHRQ